MNIFKVTCFSTCGSYFAAYLQSVTVIASSEEEAKNVAENGTEYKFIFSKDKWDVIDLGPFKPESGVIDYHYDSDY